MRRVGSLKRFSLTMACGMLLAGCMLGNNGWSEAKAASYVPEDDIVVSESALEDDGLIYAGSDEADILGAAAGINQSYAWKVLDIVNQERAKAGVPALSMDLNLLATANLRAVECSSYFSHVRPNGQECFSAFPSVVGYPIGENIAAGYWSPETVMEGWMNSAGHRGNILSAGYKSIGIACYYDPNAYYGYYWVQCFGGSVSEKAVRPGSTVYDGIDYSAVYNFDYYMKKNADLKKVYANNPAGALKHFVTYGMKEGRVASKNFDVSAYANANYDLRKAYKNDMKQYYIHYICHGKKEGRKVTGVKTMEDGPVYYGGINYSAVFSSGYYKNKYSDLQRMYGYDDAAYLKHFVTKGMKEGRQAKASFNVKHYRKRYPDLKKKYGSNLKKYYIHYVKFGKDEGRKGK